MADVSVPGARLHVTTRGAGEPVLLVHDVDADATVWARHAEALADAGYRAVTFDARGHGDSTPYGTDENPWSRLDVDTLVDDARAVLDAHAPDGAHVVGHGVGGAVAAWLAYWEGATRVRSLTVAACPPAPGEAYRAAHRRALADAPEADAYEVARHRAVLALLAEIPEDEFPGEFLTQYHGPALVTEAATDPLYSPTDTMFWSAWLRNGRVTRVDGGHDFPFDGGDGEARFRALLLEHLEGVTA